MNPFELLPIAASLMENLAVVVVNINPKIQLVIARSQIQCLVESFAVFPERAAWPCEGVYWIQSDYPVLSFGCTYFHRSPHWLISSLSTLASPRKQAENPAHPAHPSVVPDLCLLMRPFSLLIATQLHRNSLEPHFLSVAKHTAQGNGRTNRPISESQQRRLSISRLLLSTRVILPSPPINECRTDRRCCQMGERCSNARRRD